MRGKKTQNSQLIITEEQSHRTDTKATCINIFYYLQYYYILVLYFGEGNGTLLQYSCLENPMDAGAW